MAVMSCHLCTSTLSPSVRRDGRRCPRMIDVRARTEQRFRETRRTAASLRQRRSTGNAFESCAPASRKIVLTDLSAWVAASCVPRSSWRSRPSSAVVRHRANTVGQHALASSVRSLAAATVDIASGFEQTLLPAVRSAADVA